MKNVLAAVDFSDVTDRVLSTTAVMAKALGAKIWLLHAVTDTSIIGGMGEVPAPFAIDDQDLPRHFPSEDGRLRDAVAELSAMGFEAQGLLVSGPAIEQIIAAAQTREAELIIVGSHGHGALYELLVGTVSEGVIRRAHQPVLIVPSRAGKDG